LHIGGARTALFNWLLAKHHGGKFLLRIEDTDQKRSTNEAVEAIYNGLKWLGIDWDGEVFSQFERRHRHINVANQLVEKGLAYRCFCTPEELAQMRDKALKQGSTRLYDGTWRDKDPSKAPLKIEPSIRLRVQLEGNSTIEDAIQGPVTVDNCNIDDMVLLRSDGTPTYMLAVVVDDHEMDITHVVRGDDHLTNTFRQIQIYKAMNWKLPVFAHMPLLHGVDGKKLSKRHGALGINAYKEMGFLPEAINNYLLRLGWSHGNHEIISKEQAIKWFRIKKVGKSPSRFDMDKLNNLSNHYIRYCDNDRLINLMIPEINNLLGDRISPETKIRLKKGIDELKHRVNNIKELVDNSIIYCIKRPILIEENEIKKLDKINLNTLGDLYEELKNLETWGRDELSQLMREIAEKTGKSLGKIAQPLRSALCGDLPAPGISEVMRVLGKKETLSRLKDAL